MAPFLISTLVRTIMDKCFIKGPYYPLGEVDWYCSVHNLYAELKNPSQTSGFKRTDFYCPFPFGVSK